MMGGEKAALAFNILIEYNDCAPAAEIHTPMATLTIRNIDPAVKERLRIRAAQHGHSMGAKALRILQWALAEQDVRESMNLAERVHARFAALGGVETELPPREPGREPPTFK
jgi:plasmid stability protein